MATNDFDLMSRALKLARQAAEHGDVPVGCVVVVGGTVVAEAENRREVDNDPTAHAEVLALRVAAAARGSWRLDDAEVYVTLEPCVMCAGALLNARVSRVIIGAPDLRAGAVGSRYNLLADPRLYHEVETTHDVLAVECGDALREFFAGRRGVDTPEESSSH